MNDDVRHEDGEPLKEGAVTPEPAQAETARLENANRPALGDGKTPGNAGEDAPTLGDVRNEGDEALQTPKREDAENVKVEAFSGSEESLGGLAEATASGAGEPQAVAAVDQAAFEESSANEPPPPAVDRRKTPRGPRPSLSEEREAVFHDDGGYRLRIEPADLAKLRELPGAKGKTDRELGEEFFKGQSARLVASMAGDVETPAEVRVVVDPYSRQAFLAVGRTIRGIVSF